MGVSDSLVQFDKIQSLALDAVPLSKAVNEDIREGPLVQLEYGGRNVILSRTVELQVQREVIYFYIESGKI